ncbi:site-specific tyrosine recombinase XerC [Erwinia pyrifoliae]|uniref:site-specific tyrosine recombinase XerC n=1 Tax=Erwinia pyrifoliae TaxID=79967 RepID=UPI00220745DC|nr:site-specific tyrosine recombinase XerC [Erwinia pyrifoliae]UWS28313.1 site-specific tyrosine recombinase XerC [Erwinia pyrifoliae]UWS29782.1 site-specific tyrosine recombinase XerC [Erwinia pyrifoliae]UXK11316.1 site-specific tyrosine recombinase XerC [Erwinia pyrifoliae]UXK12797.1 site-specific tyrosine recombinase XerC [Erwinia pyrifoliae]UXK12804.1 site-specific tyrosine recombinase XerC [Erwinia pyrifoliae]
MTRPNSPTAPENHISQQGQTLRRLAESWLAHLAAAGRSPRTVQGYRERVLAFLAWCEPRGIRYAPQVSLAVLESYQRYLRGYRKADGTLLAVNGQRHLLSAIRMLLRWLLQRHHILYNPAELLALPKEERRLPAQVFSEAETRRVLQSLDAGTPPGLRNRAILELLWSTGIRRTELANLLLSDVDAVRGVVNVRRGKGGRDRVVPVGHTALIWLGRYLKDVRPRLAQRFDSGHLFISHKGTGLGRSTLTAMAGRAIREGAHLKKAGACHIFRHSMATQMLENGADTRHIQAILGHEKLETTQIYTRVAIGHLQKVHAHTHPAEKRRTEKLAEQPDSAEPENTAPEVTAESPDGQQR